MTRRLAGALALLLLLLAPPARASVDEFSTYDLAAMEEDDENFLDRWLARVPLEWHDAYAASPNAFRTSQGCYTSGSWFMHHDFKARAALGRRALLDIGFQQVSDDVASWQWMRFDFRWPTDHAGTFGFRFQPSADKSQHDFAALWDWGEPGDPLEVRAALTLEDAFNSLWEFRQARVGDHHEPYRAHPVEPALWVASRGRRHRVEVGGKWLTPMRKEIQDPDTTRNGSYALWGAKGTLLAELLFERWELEARFASEQVRSLESVASVPGDGRRFLRRWQGELALRASLGGTWRSELRGAYQDRTQDWRPPLALATMRALDRGVGLEVSGEPLAGWRLRLGALHDRVGVGGLGALPASSYGTRTESRGYVGLELKLGRVRVQGIEGIEFDREPYEVSFHHDKGFLQLQAEF